MLGTMRQKPMSAAATDLGLGNDIAQELNDEEKARRLKSMQGAATPTQSQSYSAQTLLGLGRGF